MNNNIIDKSVDWIKSNWRNYIFKDKDNEIGFLFWESDYRKYMESLNKDEDITDDFLKNFGLKFDEINKTRCYLFIDFDKNSNTSNFISIDYDNYEIEVINGYYIDKSYPRSTHRAYFKGSVYNIKQFYDVLNLCDIDVNRIKEHLSKTSDNEN